MSRFPPLADVENPFDWSNRAETFAESDVTLSHNTTEVADEKVQIVADPFPDGNIIADRPADNNSVGVSSGAGNGRGLKINPNTDLNGIAGKVSANTSTVSDAYLTDTSGTVLGSAKVENGEFAIGEPLSANTAYYLYVNNGGDGFTVGYYDAASYPYTHTDLDITAGVLSQTSETTTSAYAIIDLQGIDYHKSGSVAIEWPEPSNVYRWDAAKFQRTPDSETAQVDIQESADGGDTWTTIATNISRGQDITADPSNRCRLRVQLDRASTSNNPTLDAAYRRWVV